MNNVARFVFGGMQQSTIVALGIAVAALALRLWLVDFPFGQHPDEPIIGNLMQRSVEQGSITANWDGFEANWSRPTYQFSPYTLVQSVVARAVYWFAGWPDGLVAYVTLGRVCSCIYGALAVLCVYFLGRACFTEGAALVGETILALSFLAVQDSIYARGDSFLCLLVIVTLLLFIHALKQPGAPRVLWLACLCAGITTAAKYNALPVLVMLLLVVGRWTYLGTIPWRRSVILFVSGIVVAGNGFVLAMPEIIWRPGPLIEGFEYELNHYTAGQVPFVAYDLWDNNLFYWYRYLGWLGFGWLPLFCLLAFFTQIRRYQEAALAIFLVAALLIVCGTKTRFERNLEICLGAMAVTAGAAAWQLWCWAKARSRWQRAFAATLVILGLAQPAQTFIRFHKVEHSPTWTERLSPAFDVPTLSIPAFTPPRAGALNEYQQIILKDMGDPFSKNNSVEWQRIIGTQPVGVWRSGWPGLYPFSTVNFIHAAREIMIFRR
jgi:4-amino-4-deoxy-L-arabinose transferase-like glycosyltransferase